MIKSYDISCAILYIAKFFSDRKMFQAKFAEKIKTYILCSIIFFSENRGFYETTWKSIESQIGDR